MNDDPVHLRVVAENGENVILTVTREETPSLDSLLRILRRLHPGGPNSRAVQYEDDEGDLVTVTNDEEVLEMIGFASLIESDGVDDPLLVFPKAISGVNNIHSLTLALSSPPPSGSNDNVNNYDNFHQTPPNNSVVESKKSARQPSADLGQILSQGQISYSQLEYFKLLGKGNSGTVHHSLHKATKQPLAVKVIRLENPDSDTQSQIISELHSLHQCNSNFIISFYGAFFRENCIHICTEFMDGGSLDQYGAIPESVLRSVGVAMIQGLHYLWSSLKIMHRDVKPSNVLVNSLGEIKLCDFGVSIQLEKSIAKSFVGTNAYMSPERIQGVGYGMASDIWSLGLSLLEMVLGRFPFPRGAEDRVGTSSSTECSALSFMQIILHRNPDMPAKDSVSPEFHDLLVRSLQRNPDSRISSADFSKHPFFQKHPVKSMDEMKEIVRCWILQCKE